MDIAWSFRVGSFSMTGTPGTKLLTCRITSTCTHDLKHAEDWLKKHHKRIGCGMDKTRGCDGSITFTVELDSSQEKVRPVWKFLHERTLDVLNTKLQAISP